VFLPDSNHTIQIQVTIWASYHVLAAKPNMWIIGKSLFVLVFFGAITNVTSYKGGIGELSNKAATDFEIAKTPLAFPSHF
jgi:hypothetical protein